MKYIVLFETDDSKIEEIMSKEKAIHIGLIQSDDETIDKICFTIDGTLRRLPPRMPQNAYEFETYTNGYAKGNNDVLDKIEGKNGEYDPEVDKR